MSETLAKKLKWGQHLCDMTPKEADTIISAQQFAEDMQRLKRGISIYPPSETCCQWRVNQVGELDLIQADTLFEAIGKLK